MVATSFQWDLYSFFCLECYYTDWCKMIWGLVKQCLAGPQYLVGWSAKTEHRGSGWGMEVNTMSDAMA